MEYAWLYPLADCNGSFEVTSVRAIWSKVSTIRPRLTCQKISRTLDEFERHGLLFVWEENGKRYAHWTNSDRPGRLPSRADRFKYGKLAPPVPEEELASYTAQFQGPISRQHRDKLAPVSRMGFGVGVGLGEGAGLGEGVDTGAPQIAAQSTAAQTAAAFSVPVEKHENSKAKSAMERDESLRAEAERQKEALYKRFGKIK